jgi:[ribosomal protein S18]-alanine N-acetyltransferase
MSAAAIQLRPACAQDAQAIARMSRDLIEAGLGWSYDVPRIVRLIADADTVALVACDQAGPVGFAIMQFGEERAHLVLLAVMPRQQRRGVARRLVSWLLESARSSRLSSAMPVLAPSTAAWASMMRACCPATTSTASRRCA